MKGNTKPSPTIKRSSGPKKPPNPRGSDRANNLPVFKSPPQPAVDSIEDGPFEPQPPVNEKSNALDLITKAILGIAFIAMIYTVYHYWYLIPARGTMPGYAVLFFALSLAFMWVEVLHWGYKKPFNCVKCLTGWFALILAYTYHTQFWYLYPFAGVFVGAMWSAIKMRYL